MRKRRVRERGRRAVDKLRVIPARPTNPRPSGNGSPHRSGEIETEKADQSGDRQSGTRHVHKGRETNGGMQIRRLDRPFRPSCIAVDDDLLIERMPRMTRPAKPRNVNSSIGGTPTMKIGSSGNKSKVSGSRDRIGDFIPAANDGLHGLQRPWRRIRRNRVQWPAEITGLPSPSVFRRAIRRSAAGLFGSRCARRSSHCRHPSPAPPRRCDGSSRPCRRA
jgi:hypothetical protein